MKEITATQLARQLRAVLNQVEVKGATLSIVRNGQRIARLSPGTQHMTALEALSDIYQTLSDRPTPAAPVSPRSRKQPTAPRKQARRAAAALFDATLEALVNPWDS